MKNKKTNRAPVSTLTGKRHNTRKTLSTVLIVCEDEKSSVDYFKKFCRENRLTSAHVEICGEQCNSAPISVVNYTKERVNSAKTGNRTNIDVYDKVYCVIDVDEHETLGKALIMGRDNGFEMIVSNPCFEYWYLLHKQKDGSAISNRKKLYARIKTEFGLKESYDKSGCPFFDILYPLTETAKENSAAILRSQWQHEDNIVKRNPSTLVHELIGFLQKMVNT